MKKILIVDDIFINREILKDILQSAGYECEEAADGEEALEKLRSNIDAYGLVLLDIVMPNVDGFGVLEEMNRRDWLDEVPVIVITGELTQEVEDKALSLHASDYIRKPFDDSIVLKRAGNIFELYSYKRSLEQKVDEKTRELREANEVLSAQAAQIKLFNENIVDFLGVVVEYRHTESGLHVKRVKEYTELLCRKAMAMYPEYELTENKIQRIAQASVLHDLGKVAIPDSILLKPGRLTDEEYDFMKNHTVMGAELVLQVKGAWDDDFRDIAYDICRHHHERYDGKGYPDGLTGEETPFCAQAVSIADVYDALVEDRVYKKAFTHEVAIDMILHGECGTFSPKLLECLKQVEEDFRRISQG